MNAKLSTTLSTSVALLLLTVGGACDSEDDSNTEERSVKCSGINECEGTSECAGPSGENDCQGMNSCAGMGWITVESEEACTSAGGEIVDE